MNYLFSIMENLKIDFFSPTLLKTIGVDKTLNNFFESTNN